MKIAAIQHDIVWEDPDATREHVRPLIAEAAAQGAQLIVLTEMYATGFSMNPDKIAEDEGGPNEQFLRDQAAAFSFLNALQLIDICATRRRRTAHMSPPRLRSATPTATTATTRSSPRPTAQSPLATRRSTRSATPVSTSATPLGRSSSRSPSAT